MSTKKQGRATRKQLKEEVRIARVEKVRAKEKPQRRSVAISLLIISMLLIGAPLIVVVVSHLKGGHVHLPIGLLVFDVILIPATLWAVYDWLK